MVSGTMLSLATLCEEGSSPYPELFQHNFKTSMLIMKLTELDPIKQILRFKNGEEHPLRPAYYLNSFTQPDPFDSKPAGFRCSCLFTTARRLCA